jgi:hypothetical protein
MDPLRITTVLSGRQRPKKMVKAGAHDLCEGLIEGYRRVEAKLSRFSQGWRCLSRKVKAARRLAAD